MSIQKSIRRVLKEEVNEKLKSKLLSMISSEGLVKTSRRVNGVENLSKILNVPIGTLIMDQIGNRTYSTDDLERIGITTGGYDFKFEINNITLEEYSNVYGLECKIYFTIKEGTVTLIMTNDETHDLLDPQTRRKEWWWEVRNEIQDLIYEYVSPYLGKLNLYILDYDILFD